MFYQMGVMKALQELAPEILRSASKIYGTSSGALIATLVTCGCEIGKKRLVEFTLCRIVLFKEKSVDKSKSTNWSVH